jgi:hypothetical protein
MSGRKCSEFQLQQERTEKLRLLQSLTSLHAEVQSLKERTATLLDTVSGGVRASFPNEVHSAQQWLSQIDFPDIKGFGMDTNSVTLRTTNSKLEQAAVQGRQARETLTIAFTQKADELGRRLAGRLAEVERIFISRQQLLRLWCDEAQTQRWERTLQEARQLLDTERYPTLAPLLDALAQELRAQGQRAEEQEDKHQKRLYLLKALRQVCAEMGFQEVSDVRRERAGDRSSSIFLTVDTMDRGQIDFTLSLDQISTFAGIDDNYCFAEFGKLSRALEEEFGVQTQFRPVDGTPAPQLIRKGEMDLPDGATATVKV